MTGWRLHDPLRLAFQEVARHRPVDLLSPFVQHDRTAGLVRPAGEPLRLGPGPRAPFCAVLVDVSECGAGGGVLCGLEGPGGVRAVHRADERTVTVEVAGPDGPVVAGSAPAPLVGPFRLACVVNENRVTVLAAHGGNGGDWRPLLTVRETVSAVTDLRDPAVLGSLEYACGVLGTGATTLTRLRAGYSGAVGLRDPQVVRRPDGSPVIRDGRLLLTATNAGLGFFQQAHWGVWSLDPADPSRLTQVGALFSERDDLLLGDHAGAVVVDEDKDECLVLVSSWGDHTPERGVHVRHVTVRGTDLLSGVHVLRTERLALPTTASAWDPSPARVDGRWFLAFTECPSFGPPRYVFHPALAVAPGDDPTDGLVRVGADDGLEQAEGTVLQRLGRAWYVLASDRDAAEYPVYDLGLRRVGRLDAPYGTNIPHPMVVQAGERGRGPWWMITFDGTPWHEDVLGYGTHGDLVVLVGRPPSRRRAWRSFARAQAARLPQGLRRRLRAGLSRVRSGRS